MAESGSTALPLPEAKITKAVFEGANVAAQLPPKVSFEGAQSAIILPVPLKPDTFEGIKGAAQLPTKTSFKGVKASATLSPVTFEDRLNQEGIKVMFPNKNPLVATPVMGVPLGVEKPYIGNDIKEKDKNK